MMDRRLMLALAGSALFALPVLAATDSQFATAGFEAAQAAGKPIVLHISATWCETCQAQRAVLDKLEKDAAFADFQIMTIDFDTQKDAMRSFKVVDRSTLVVFKGKTEVGRVMGDTKLGSIKALLQKAL
jgi:thioredoxin 1